MQRPSGQAERFVLEHSFARRTRAAIGIRDYAAKAIRHGLHVKARPDSRQGWAAPAILHVLAPLRMARARLIRLDDIQHSADVLESVRLFSVNQTKSTSLNL